MCACVHSTCSWFSVANAAHQIGMSYRHSLMKSISYICRWNTRTHTHTLAQFPALLMLHVYFVRFILRAIILRLLIHKRRWRSKIKILLDPIECAAFISVVSVGQAHSDTFSSQKGEKSRTAVEAMRCKLRWPYFSELPYSKTYWMGRRKLKKEMLECNNEWCDKSALVMCHA